MGVTMKTHRSPNVLPDRARSCTSMLVTDVVMTLPALSRIGWCTSAAKRTGRRPGLRLLQQIPYRGNRLRVAVSGLQPASG